MQTATIICIVRLYCPFVQSVCIVCLYCLFVQLITCMQTVCKRLLSYTNIETDLTACVYKESSSPLTLSLFSFTLLYKTNLYRFHSYYTCTSLKQHYTNIPFYT